MNDNNKDKHSYSECKRIEALWAQEVEERIDAFNRGEISARPVSEVFEEIKRSMQQE